MEKAEQIALAVEKANRNAKLVNHEQAQEEVQVANTGKVLKFEGNRSYSPQIRKTLIRKIFDKKAQLLINMHFTRRCQG